MPFTPTAHAPSPNAFVTVQFAGLMLLSPGPNNSCNVGIHHWAPMHTFQAILIVNKPGSAPRPIRLFSGPLTGQFRIDLDPLPAMGDFQAYAPTPLPFVRSYAGNNVKDYRWAVNLKDLHPTADYNEGGRPIGTLSTGVLYTPTRTREDFRPRFKRGGLESPLHFISAELAAAIQPQTSPPKVKISWAELGQPQSLVLPRRFDPDNTFYQISLVNDPPLHTPLTHDELDLYYRILTINGRLIDEDDRWRLEYPGAQRTDDIPCIPGTMEP